MLPQTRESRRWFLAAALVALPAAGVFCMKGIEKPWTPECPDYRQHGDAGARALIVEFSDFQCPACAAAAPVIHQLEAQYGSKLRVLYKHRPWLDMHRWAKDAALAGECSGKQGKFWEMHDLLFAKQADWALSEDAPRRLDGYAQSLGLRMPEFRGCVKDPVSFAAVEADVRDAKDHWINATPTFFVNGRRLVGGRQLKLFAPGEIERRIGS